jgi:hypothetical protein
MATTETAAGSTAGEEMAAVEMVAGEEATSRGTTPERSALTLVEAATRVF